jgi:protoheme IX farnesyltransferase
MAIETTAAVLERARAERRHLVRWKAIADYWALTKPEVNFLIAITTFAGFCLALPSQSHPFPFMLLLHALLGTLLVAGGTGTLNQYVERRFDAQMRRTARRPVASGRIEPCHALRFGISLSLAGTVYLALAVNVLTSLLALATLLSYLFLYTPLKRVTPFCVLVGAFPGAMPPLIGWAAARGRIDPEAWVLYAMLFLWQFPHFMAIAWMYREDYTRASYLVLPAGALRNRFVVWQTVVPSLALTAVSLVPTINGESGLVYFFCALILGSIFFYYGGRFAFGKSNLAARRLLAASIPYLPAVFILMILTKK